MIRSLSLRNFMSYVSADIPLSRGVNFVCGPNGAGKSTLLIAISLALGMSHTERGKRLSDLIRWGAERSSIRLVLDNRVANGSRPFPDHEVDDLVIERSLTRAGSYPIKIDGVPSTKEELTELISRHGINPDNMLIIMQQDMVEEFSLLSPASKLSMFEEVIEFQSYRRDLLQARDDLEALLGEEAQTRRILDGSNRRVTEWERLYEKYQRKRKLEDELEELSAEALWAKVAEGERGLQQLGAKRGERSQELEHITGRMEELGRRLEERSHQVEESWAELESRKKALLTTTARQATSEASASLLRERIEEERAGVESIRAALARDRTRIETTLSKLSELRAGSPDEGLLLELETELSEARTRFEEVAFGSDVAGLERDLASSKALLGELEARITETRERISHPFGVELKLAGEALQSDANLAGEVYGPIYTCTESDEFTIDTMRILLGEELLRSFVVTRESDKAKVLKLLRSRGLDSRVYFVPESALVLIGERYLPDDDGVLGWAVDGIRAPRHVKALLEKISGEFLLVRSDVPIEEISRSLNTPVINREGKRAGFLQSMISEAGGKATREAEKQEKELQRLTSRHADVEKEISRLTDELETARGQQEEELRSVLDYILSVHVRLELLRSEGVPADAVLQREAARVEASSGALAEHREREISERERLLRRLDEDLSGHLDSGKVLSRQVTKDELAYQRSRDRLERQLKAYYDMESKRLVLSDQLRSAKAAIRDLDYRTSKQKADVENLIQNAEELSPRISSPRELLELEKDISNIRGSLSELTEVPDDIEGVYKMYLSEYETLRRSLESIIEKREEMGSELKKGLDRWREMMEGHLTSVNKDFNEILSEIGGRGRVELVGDDVRGVGLEIWVGFEGKEMTSISTLTQSGGEKSLSTMAFLLALQRQVKSPFRAVDEYDVHLDPMNRSRVTKLLKSAVRRDSKQYIAITPSQISRGDLEEAENVVVVQSVGGRSRVGSLVMEAG